MDIMEYEKQKIANVPVELLCYKMLRLTGGLNYASLLCALCNEKDYEKWNSKSREL